MTWLACVCVSGIVQMYHLAAGAVCYEKSLLLRSLWHKCGSGTGTHRKCRLLAVVVSTKIILGNN